MKSIKNIILIVTLIIFTQNIYSQNKIYLDVNWNETNQDNASFYRIVEKKNDSLFYVKDYYINGNLQMDGHFSNIKKSIYEGLLNWYNSQGKITHSITYKKGIALGESINYNINGDIISKGTYKNDLPFNGTIKNDCSCPVMYANYKNGKKESEIIYYKNSNKIAAEKFFLSDFEKNGINGEYPKKEIFYNKQGAIIATLHYSVEKTNYKSHGTDIEFYEEDHQVVSVKKKTIYLDENKNGKEITYHKNGKIWLTGTNKDDDKFDGDFLWGLTQRSYKNGIQVGDRITYNKDFKVIVKASYKNDKPYNGTTISYKTIKTYKDGFLTQKEEYYNEDFKQIKSKTTYTNQEILTVWFNIKGKTLGSGYTNNEGQPQNGIHIDYNKHTNYKDGKKQGLETEFNDHDKIVVKRMFNADSIVWVKTPKISKPGFFHCDYKNNELYNGVFNNYGASEQYYKNGTLIKAVEYDKNEETEQFEVTQITEYKLNKYERREKIKEINYIKNKAYTVTFIDDKPYDGVYIYYKSKLETYKNGIKEGYYEIFESYGKDAVIESGNFKDGEKNGLITFSPLSIKSTETTCEFENGKPINGTVFTKKEKTTYKKGLIDGEKTLFHTNIYKKENTEIIHYLKGKKEGKTSFTSKDINTIGEYKNDEPYHGDFYNIKTNTKNSYQNGQKNGVEIRTIFYTKITTNYKKDFKIWQESRFIKNDSLLTKGTYKNNKPYSGSFLSFDANAKRTRITHYKKGKKEGKESSIKTYEKTIHIVEYFTYKNGLKNGNYYLSNRDKLPYKMKSIKGVYKNDKPYTGRFLTSNQQGLKIVSNYINGKKEGLELYETSYNKVDSLFYKKGKITHGVQLELLEGSYGGYYYSHYFENGQRTKTKIREKIEVIYTKNGFSIVTKNGIGNELIPTVIFDDKTQTSGTINYFINKKLVGSFIFAKGKLLSGKMSFDTPEKDFIGGEVKVIDKQIVTTFKLEPKAGLYYEMSRLNTIPNFISYKDFNLLITGLAIKIWQNKVNHIKQYLNDGTLLTEATIKNEKMIGTVIVSKKQKTGTYLYSVTTLKKGEKRADAVTIEGLGYNEMLKKIEELKKG